MTRPVTYSERQRLRVSQGWLIPVVGLGAVPVALLGAIVLVIGQGSAVHWTAFVVVAVLVPFGIVVLLARMVLDIEVNETAIRFAVRPLHRSYRTIRFEEVEGWRIERPRARYYGIARLPGRWEYTFDGTDGILLCRRTGISIFLGTADPHRVAALLERGGHNGR